MWGRENLGTSPSKMMHREEIKQRKEALHEAVSALWKRAALGYGWMHSSHLYTWIPSHFFRFSLKWNNLSYELSKIAEVFLVGGFSYLLFFFFFFLVILSF